MSLKKLPFSHKFKLFLYNLGFMCDFQRNHIKRSLSIIPSNVPVPLRQSRECGRVRAALDNCGHLNFSYKGHVTLICADHA